MINKIECKKLINKILNKKHFYDYDNYIIELLVQLYLILTNKRKLAQIFVHKDYAPKSVYNKLLFFLNKFYKYYIIKEDKYGTYLIIYHKKYDVNKLNQKFGKKYAQNLGDFYVCATNNINNKHLIRPVISVSYYSKPYRKYKNHIYFELYAQMCSAHKYVKNFDKLRAIKKRYQKYLSKINKRFLVQFEVQ